MPWYVALIIFSFFLVFTPCCCGPPLRYRNRMRMYQYRWRRPKVLPAPPAPIYILIVNPSDIDTGDQPWFLGKKIGNTK